MAGIQNGFGVRGVGAAVGLADASLMLNFGMRSRFARIFDG